ncbi:TPA: hypothetical protein ACGWTM_002957 [Legionella pneumophila]
MMKCIFSSKYLYIALFGISLLIVLVSNEHQSAIKRKNSELISTRLDTIQTQLGALHQEVKKPIEPFELTTINKDFSKLTSLIEQIKANDENTLNQIINKNRTELIQKLDLLQDLIKGLDSKQHPIKYLPATSLPFDVISIDSIQQVTVATVAYDFKSFPVEKNDRLAGWTVLNINFAKQRIELENNKKERVVVTLNVEQGESDV